MQNRVTDSRLAAIAPYNGVRIVLGLLLLTAAALKGHQLATEPVAETGWKLFKEVIASVSGWPRLPWRSRGIIVEQFPGKRIDDA